MSPKFLQQRAQASATYGCRHQRPQSCIESNFHTPMSSRASARSKEFKSTVSINSERNRRTQQQVQIRKDKREQGLQKRRRAAAWTSKAEESAKPAAGFTKVPAELSVAHLSAYIAGKSAPPPLRIPSLTQSQRFCRMIKLQFMRDASVFASCCPVRTAHP